MTGSLGDHGAREMIESMPIGLVALDSTGHVVFSNEAVTEILGWAPEDLLGKQFHATVHPRRPNGTAYPYALCPLAATQQDRESRALDRETLWRRDGSRVICDVTASALATGGVTVTLRDAFARLELARAQDEFVGVVSHELRTPLASLLGALKLTTAEGLAEGQREMLIGLARRNADRLARLVDDILDLEKARVGALALTRMEMTGPSLSASAVDAVTGTALAHEVTLTSDADDMSFWGDRMRLEQVLTNLLDNAVKYSPPGGTVTLRMRKSDAEVTMDVIDEGAGVAPEDLKRVFDKFWQIDSSNQRIRQGSGLGLTISQAIMELHGGSISGTSEIGKGTCFTVHLPIRTMDLSVPVDLRTPEGKIADAPRPVD